MLLPDPAGVACVSLTGSARGPLRQLALAGVAGGGGLIDAFAGSPIAPVESGVVEATAARAGGSRLVGGG